MHQTDERGVGSGVFNMNREPADTNWNKNVIGEKDPEWLKRAELSVQEKQALTQSNQFIPYSLVMSKKDCSAWNTVV